MSEKSSVTLHLKCVDDAENLTYVVEIVSKDGTFKCYNSENYNQALFVAKEVFSRLTKKQEGQLIGDIETIIEAEHGTGAAYDVNNFCPPSCSDDKESFYRNMFEEIETLKIKKCSLNEAFRKLVNKYKLNEYQEHRFLTYIKKWQ